MTAVYTNNQLPNIARDYTTPYELLRKAKPLMSRTLYLCMSTHPSAESLVRKSHRCIFLVYAENSNVYRVHNIDDQGVIVSRKIALEDPPPAMYDPVPIGQLS
ncbi:hypothetical protein PsorP6_018804 [Peronosclerospora sorghi]|nr:hypothetical protein PsorP6_018804 [Peronosclerospora sorghi]